MLLKVVATRNAATFYASPPKFCKRLQRILCSFSEPGIVEENSGCNFAPGFIKSLP